MTRQRIVVLKRSALPSGGSTKNAGFVCFGSISELLEQEKRGDLLAMVAARWAGLGRLRELVGDGPLDYQPVGSYVLFRHEETAPANECRDKIGYFDALLAPMRGRQRTFRDTSTGGGHQLASRHETRRRIAETGQYPYSPTPTLFPVFCSCVLLPVFAFPTAVCWRC